MNYEHSLDWATEAALQEAELIIFNIIKRVHPLDCLDRTIKFMKVVRDACEHDKRRHGSIRTEISAKDWLKGADFSRLYPINIGRAENTTSLPDATIYLVDSTTKPNGNPKPFVIQGKSFRPYLPWRGNKGDKAYHILIKQNLWGEFGNSADEITNKIIETTIGPDGMYKPKYPREFEVCAPKMALIYANVDRENKSVLMLRPNEKYLHHLEYKAYCYVVMSAILKRFGGWCDLNFLNTIPKSKKEEYQLSMIVKDDMLITKYERDLPLSSTLKSRAWINPGIVLPFDIPKIEIPEFLMAA